MMKGKHVSNADAKLYRARDNGAAKRFFWRVWYRFGDDWSKMTAKQINKELRMVSWRRP